MINLYCSATTQESLCNIEIQVHPATGADLQNKWVSVILVISPFLQVWDVLSFKRKGTLNLLLCQCPISIFEI